MEHNIKVDFEAVKYKDWKWIHVAKDRIKAGLCKHGSGYRVA
jgi:hypothetical protein